MPERRWLRKSEFEKRPAGVQPSGHDFAPASLMRGLSSETWPLTDARCGVQQQNPSFTQQVIPQASAVWVARIVGAEIAATNKNKAAKSARNFPNRACAGRDIGVLSYYKSRARW